MVLSKNPCERRLVQVNGIVQGVGFRPFVYRAAKIYDLSGTVWNDSAGVTIDVTGKPDQLDAFLLTIECEAPPLAVVEAVTWQTLPQNGYQVCFTIAESRAKEGPATLVAPDIAMCDECLADLLDPTNRRYGYPFINCTNCGPRFTIIQQTPYDRPHTTMVRLYNVLNVSAGV